MIVERYSRDYVFVDHAYIDGSHEVAETGFRLSNSCSYGGDVDLPGFKCRNLGKCEFLPRDVRIEHGRPDHLEAMRYVRDSSRKFLNGEKSDWKVTSVLVEPAKLRFVLRNKKLKKLQKIARELDCDVHDLYQNKIEVPDALRIEFGDEIFRHGYVVVEVSAAGRNYVLALCRKWRDANGEKRTDYCDFFFGTEFNTGEEYAAVKEWHKKSPERRTTELRWAKNKNGESDKHHMLGEVEE